MDLEVWRRQQFVLGVAPPWMLVEPESTNVRAHHLPILSSLKAIPAQLMYFQLVPAKAPSPIPQLRVGVVQEFLVVKANTLRWRYQTKHGYPKSLSDQPTIHLNPQICTAMIFLFVAAWPFTPVLVHWRPWTPESTYAFLGLLVILAWVLMARSHSIYAALLSSLLTLALTGLTAWEYTTEQIRLR